MASSVSRHVATIQFSGIATQSPLDQASFNTTRAFPTLATRDKITTSAADGVLEMSATSTTDWTASCGFTVAAQDASKVTMIAYDLYTSIQSGVSPSCTHADGAAARSSLARSVRVSVVAVEDRCSRHSSRSTTRKGRVTAKGAVPG